MAISDNNSYRAGEDKPIETYKAKSRKSKSHFRHSKNIIEFLGLNDQAKKSVGLGFASCLACWY